MRCLPIDCYIKSTVPLDYIPGQPKKARIPLFIPSWVNLKGHPTKEPTEA